MAENLVEACGSKLLTIPNGGELANGHTLRQSDQDLSGTLQQYLADLAAIGLTTLPTAHTNLPGEFSTSISRDIKALQALPGGLDSRAVRQFLDVLEQCEGQLFMSGIGKSGQVAQRFSSSLSSVGIPSQFVHASEWAHGDLGKVTAGRDVVLFVSHSGNTAECVGAAKELLARGVTTLTLTGNKDSSLGKLCVSALVYPHNLQEPFGCLPTTSLVLQDAMLNGLISELVSRKGISRQTFKDNHPGGAIGATR